jgi:hypothetical protein
MCMPSFSSRSERHCILLLLVTINKFPGSFCELAQSHGEGQEIVKARTRGNTVHMTLRADISHAITRMTSFG